MTDIPTLALNDGRSIPALGLGTYKIPDTHAPSAVRDAVDIGYRLVDTAALYDNERGAGSGLINQPDVFLTTKLWHDRHDDAEAALDESLALLGRDSVDCYLIHWPHPSGGQFVQAWRTLIELRAAGKTRSIGVANFLPEHIEALADATGVLPVLNQIELHPHFQQRRLREFHARHDIVTQSWSPLGQGKTIEDPVIARIAGEHGATPAQVILAWHLHHGFSAIPKASGHAHMADNFAAKDLSLGEADIAAIDALDTPSGRIGPDPLEI
ncbi:aldo/keto reductase [Sphingomonas japonica]|uniref:2,5-diketo-D-gluconate reductase A n=1 Tax=Sphingomonas japonica TaxID=511662 RepID=A0ABX0TZ05_9SPHN|nr:aldo/keto reductase [Sphingomonas japonica]NIJ23551.1 2,5-diketo-D-gluconate reductase A [Sphingomonas japonica]